MILERVSLNTTGSYDKEIKEYSKNVIDTLIATLAKKMQVMGLHESAAYSIHCITNTSAETETISICQHAGVENKITTIFRLTAPLPGKTNSEDESSFSEIEHFFDPPRTSSLSERLQYDLFSVQDALCERIGASACRKIDYRMEMNTVSDSERTIIITLSTYHDTQFYPVTNVLISTATIASTVFACWYFHPDLFVMDSLTTLLGR